MSLSTTGVSFAENPPRCIVQTIPGHSTTGWDDILIDNYGRRWQRCVWPPIVSSTDIPLTMKLLSDGT